MFLYYKNINCTFYLHAFGLVKYVFLDLKYFGYRKNGIEFLNQCKRGKVSTKYTKIRKRVQRGTAKERKGRVLRGIDVTSVLYYQFGTENTPEVKIKISSSGS